VADLTGRVALVTGAAMGIGRAIAQRLRDDGATVVATDVDERALAIAAAEIDGDPLVLDVVDEARWTAVVDEVRARHGGLHILVNNAGILGSAVARDPLTTTPADWKRVMTVNVDSVYLGCRAAIPLIAASGGGSIVNMSSAAAFGAGVALAYGTSKAAVRHMTKTIAKYCADSGLAIRCNSVHPGWVRTPLHDIRAAEVSEADGVDPEEFLAALPDSPLGGWIGPEEVAAMVSYLVSDDARQVTGAEFVIDGGAVGAR
jgi:NAD(P)-dependent dehydrogenase (short-subunit alcohol dehydrogenase family)